MPAVKLEDLVIKSLKRRAASEARRLEQRDAIVRGLAVRATPSGEVTWTFTFRLKGSRRLRRTTLGDYSHMSLGEAHFAVRRLAPIATLRATAPSFVPCSVIQHIFYTTPSLDPVHLSLSEFQ